MNKNVGRNIRIGIKIILIFIFLGVLMLLIIDKPNTYEWKIGLTTMGLILFLILNIDKYVSNIYAIICEKLHNIKQKTIVSISLKLELYSKRLKAKQSKNIDIDILSPKILEDYSYVNILKSKIDNEEVRNIAISGTYGSGKSSIIKTFKYLYPQYKCLNLSLAAFAEELQIDNTSDRKTLNAIVENDTIHMEQLEYSLVQQFFYHVKASRIPDSRFGRIRRWGRWIKFIWTFAALLFLFATLYVFNFGWLSSIFSGLQNFYNDELNYICTIISSIGIFIIMYNAITLIHKINSGHIKFMDYEVKLQKDIKISVFNRYLDELVYLFQTTGYQVVILEDLDRFKNTTIYTKLRELNLLLNQANDIGHRIVFVYALRDDIFQTSQERTKFFDFILPVIPHTNVSNSASKFVNSFEELIGDKEDKLALHKSFLNDVAPFIGDMRTIKAIVADFNISRELLDKNLPKDNLLAIIIYKNICPKEFEQIYEGKGLIKETFAKEKEFKRIKKEELKKKIEDLESEILLTEKESLLSVKELNSLVVSAALKLMPAGHFLCDSRGYPVNYSDLNKNENVQRLLHGEFRHKDYFNSSIQLSKAKILSSLGENFDYTYRLNHINQKQKSIQKNITLQRDTLKCQLESLEKKTMSELCSENEKILPSNTGEISADLLNFFIRRGYIDEKYYFYITVFNDGLLTHNDNEYLLSIKGIGTSDDDEMNRQLDDPKMVLEFLITSDFKSNKILNFDLVHEIILDNNEEILMHLMDKVRMGGSIVLDFINRYAFQQNVDDGFIKLVVKYYPKLWTDIENDALFSNEAKLNLFCRIIQFADIKDIEIQNEDGLLCGFLETLDYRNVFKNTSIIKAKEIIQTLNVKFRTLYNDTNENNFLDFIYRGNYYIHNKKNVNIILTTYSNIDLSNYNHALYSAILMADIHPLNIQIEENICSFVTNCILEEDNYGENNESIVKLINNNNLTNEAKKQIIEHNKTICDSIAKINENELKNKLYEENKVRPTIANIAYYMSYNCIEVFDSILLKYVNINADIIIAHLRTINKLSEEENIVISNLINKEGIINDIWKSIFNNPSFDILWRERILILHEEQIKFLINERLLLFDIELFKNIGKKYPELYLFLLSEYSNEVLNNLVEFNFDAHFLIMLGNNHPFIHNKTIIYAQFTTNMIDESIADDYLLYVEQDAANLKFDVLKKSIELSSNQNLKMIAVSEYMKQDFMSLEYLYELFANMGEPFVQLKNNQGELFELNKSTESYRFIEQLLRLKLVSKRSDKKFKYKLYIRKDVTITKLKIDSVQNIV